jgi:DNA-binding Xre family transcriptional regulator
MSTINKKLKLIENTHQEKTMANLSKLLKEKDMSQVELAKQLGRDKTTVNRWVKNSREVAWDNAVEIAKVLECHPIDIIEGGKSEIQLQKKCFYDGKVVDLTKEETHKIPIPYEYNHKRIIAIQMEAPGTHTDGEIWLFDIPLNKKFYKSAIGKICYLVPTKEASQAALQKYKHKCTPVVALLKPNGDGTLAIVNSSDGEPLNDACRSVPTEFLEIATPVKAKYDPDLFNIIK